ncbi:MAG: hypothetical protein ACK49D_13365 [Flavobacteriia bacterium]|jgi:hypothetical protein|nr:hypothetical protein [Cryomorphaceae bacterium]
MLLATIVIAFNLFGNSWVNISAIVQSGSTETSLRVRQSLCILDQSGFEEFDFSESEEDVETETEELFDDLFTGNHAFFRLLNGHEFPSVVSSSPVLKPLRSKEIPLYLVLQNIRL